MLYRTYECRERQKDALLYEYLVPVDAIRIGNMREAKLAAQELAKKLRKQ